VKPEFAYKKEVDGTDKEAEELLVKQLKMSLKDVVQDQMECLHRIADVRTSLKLRDYLHAACREGNRPTYQSIVGRIARDSITHDGDNLLDLEKYSSAAALPDILGMATSLGLGRFRFGSKGKPRPRDNQTVIIFVIGGITCAEIQEVLEHISAVGGGCQVLVGSTTLNTVRNVLFSCMSTSPES